MISSLYEYKPEKPLIERCLTQACDGRSTYTPRIGVRHRMYNFLLLVIECDIIRIVVSIGSAMLPLSC